MSFKEDIIAFGVIAGVTALPLVFTFPGPFEDVVLMVMFAIGAITLIDVDGGSLAVGPAELSVN